MSNGRYEAIIRSRVETRNIDFKAPLNWKLAPKCSKFEVLRDVAAMANTGGGYIVIGRDEPSFSTGTLSPDDLASFDPTDVHKVIHRYLTPALECRMEPEVVDGDTLLVIEVPGFEFSPLIFHEVGNCGQSGCKKSPHFLPGDVFIRTKAQQSTRVRDSEDMRELINRSVRKQGQEIVTEIQRMLSAPQSIEIPPAGSPYDEELDHEGREFFGPLFNPWLQTLGHFDLIIHPLSYRSDRLELRSIPTNIREFAFLIGRDGVIESIPYEGNYAGENFAYGSRLRLHKPEWRRVEGVSLCTSGLYRLVRAFPEDFRPNEDRTAAELVSTDRELWLDLFVEQMTMLHLLARNIVERITDDEDEEVQVDLRVDGLAGRLLDGARIDPLQRFLIGLREQSGTENVFYFPMQTTRRALQVDAVTIARERCAEAGPVPWILSAWRRKVHQWPESIDHTRWSSGLRLSNLRDPVAVSTIWHRSSNLLHKRFGTGSSAPILIQVEEQTV